MRYDVVFTDRARDDLEEVVEYLITEFCNKQAVEHLLLCVDNVLDNLIINPYIYPRCREPILCFKGYRIAVVSETKYVLIYRIDVKKVYIMGIFHSTEQYEKKI